LKSSSLPKRGISAHRGGAATHPENSLAAFRHAVGLGVHQIEFDVRGTADGQIVVIHDKTVDRTTDGRGAVAQLKLAELRTLDAGGEPIPTLQEVVEILPRDIWINLQIKKDEPIADAVAQLIVDDDRLHQVVVACGNAAARALRRAHPRILVCNLSRKGSRAEYLQHAIATASDFVQFHHLRGEPEPALVERARAAGLHINFFCDPESPDLDLLFRAGVDFALVDDLAPALEQARAFGIEPLDRTLA
jgi:glycerophosphoryl diester phosphodiesterase